MDTRHTVYKTDHRYNPKTFETPTQTSGTTLATTATVAAAAAAADVDIHHPRTGLHPSRGSSFREEINHVLQQWRQFQQEKKQQQQCQLLTKTKQHQKCEKFDRSMEEVLANQLKELEQEGEKIQQQPVAKSKQPPDYDEFDRIMEEDLANQLKELEQQEEQEKEYKRLEQMVEEQLKLDDPHQPMAQFAQDFRRQSEAQQSHQEQLFHRLRGITTNLEAWKAKNDKLMKLAMKKAAAAAAPHPIKTNKLLDLFKAPCRTKTYHVQHPK